MEAVFRSLERKLNLIIDGELEKPVSRVDTDLVMECSNALLRFEKEDKYAISKQTAENAVADIITKVKGRGRVRMTRTARTLLIAAVILALTFISVVCLQRTTGFDLTRFGDHSEYTFFGAGKVRVGTLTAGYIPEGYTLREETGDRYGIIRTYNNGEYDLIIKKDSLVSQAQIMINTEFEDPTQVEHDNTEYLIYGDREHGYGIDFSKSGFLYGVFGSEEPEELLKIAEAME